MDCLNHTLNSSFFSTQIKKKTHTRFCISRSNVVLFRVRWLQKAFLGGESSSMWKFLVVRHFFLICAMKFLFVTHVLMTVWMCWWFDILRRASWFVATSARIIKSSRVERMDTRRETRTKQIVTKVKNDAQSSSHWTWKESSHNSSQVANQSEQSTRNSEQTAG